MANDCIGSYGPQSLFGRWVSFGVWLSRTMSEFLIYDTMARAPMPVRASDGVAVRLYCCGPTVYGPAHIGNFRTFVLQDVFRRIIEATGGEVRHVRNVTDVDDKTIRESQAEGRSLEDFTREWKEKFHKDCRALNVLPPHDEPSAVAHIDDQVQLIETLMERGHAYRAEDGSVYFRVRSFESYGRLSHLCEREITTDDAARSTADEYDRESASDFALWKARRPEDGPNYWESPWGQGRPGWHLECSAMSMKLLGPSFDVHSGGVDLVFPHHENEIAQSEAATGQQFAERWFHIAHLMVDGTKMSKSLGNLYTLEELEGKGFTAEELRYTLQSGSYRQPLNFTLESMHAARKALARLRDFGERIGHFEGSPRPGMEGFGPFSEVLGALLDDMNTPEALGRLFGTLKGLNKELDEEVDSDRRRSIQEGFANAKRVLGLTLDAPAGGGEIPEAVVALARERWDAKQAKDWTKADELRGKLTEAGWQVKDAKDGFELTPLE